MYSTKKLKDNTLHKNFSDVETHIESLNTEIKDLILVGYTITNHSKVNKIAYRSNQLSNYEKADTIQQFREYLTTVNILNPLANNVKVYIYSTLNSYNSDGYAGGSVSSISQNEYIQLINLRQKSSDHIIINNQQISLLFLSSLNNPTNIVEISISQDTLKEYFEHTFINGFYYFHFNDSEDSQDYSLTNITDPELLSIFIRQKPTNSISNLSVNRIDYQVFTLPSSTLNGTFYSIIPEDLIIEPFNLLIIFSFIIFLFIIGTIILFFNRAIKLIQKPLYKLLNAFESIQEGNFDIRIKETNENEFTYLYQGFNEMNEYLSTLIEEVYNKNLLIQQANLKQLQAQINPHFLYNSFFMLHRMMKSNQRENALKVSDELGTYFRYITKNDSDIVLFSDEYEHAKIYASIQQMRFEKRISIYFDELPSEFETFKVPRLILQPLIENAFNHGLENKIKNGILRVQFIPILYNPLQLQICIEDNGESLSDDSLIDLQNKIRHSKEIINTSNMSGLFNIANRIRIYYKNKSNVTLRRSELGGLQIIITLEEGE